MIGTVLLGLTGGCSASSADRAAASGADGRSATSAMPDEIGPEHNPTDIAYVDAMISQHQQALDMVTMVTRKDVSAAVAEEAAAIDEARSDELAAFGRLARAWDLPPHPPEFHGNPGELTVQQLSDLYALEGEAFEERWTELMIDNHLGAVAMSRAELADGLNLAARELARALIEVQEDTAERLQALGR